MRITLDIPLSLSEITGGAEDILVNYISTDTREMSSGDLFIPISGRNFNGSDFISAARSKGAHVLDTEDGALTLLKIAGLYKSKLKRLKYTVGITGSVGKTTAKEFIYKIVSQKYQSHKTESNENNIIGVAKSILTAPCTTEALILEVGTNHIGEIKRITDVIPMDIALITNIGTSHIGNFGSQEAIAREKLCIKRDGITKLISRYEDALSGFTFSIKAKDANLYIEKQMEKIHIYKNFKLLLKSDCIFSEKHLLEEVAAAVSVCIAMGIDIETLKSGISPLSYDITRQKIIKLKAFSVFSDCYNASLESFTAAFDTISALANYPTYSAVVGDIDELSDMSRDIHYRLGATMARYNFRRIYLIGDMKNAIKEGYLSAMGRQDNLVVFNSEIDVYDIAEVIIRESREKEIILFKASRKMRLEVIIDEIKRRCEG